MKFKPILIFWAITWGASGVAKNDQNYVIQNKTLSLTSIAEILASGDINSVDSFLDYLHGHSEYAHYFSNYTLALHTRGVQVAHYPQPPRVILYGATDASLILSIGPPGTSTLELLQFDSDKKVFVMGLVDFEEEAQLVRNPRPCVACHAPGVLKNINDSINRIRPNWDAYGLWSGFICPANDECNENELSWWKTQVQTHPRYQYFKFFSISEMRPRPNKVLGKKLNRLNFQRIAGKFSASGVYAKYAHLAYLLARNHRQPNYCSSMDNMVTKIANKLPNSMLDKPMAVSYSQDFEFQLEDFTKDWLSDGELTNHVNIMLQELLTALEINATNIPNSLQHTLKSILFSNMHAERSKLFREIHLQRLQKPDWGPWEFDKDGINIALAFRPFFNKQGPYQAIDWLLPHLSYDTLSSFFKYRHLRDWKLGSFYFHFGVLKWILESDLEVDLSDWSMEFNPLSHNFMDGGITFGDELLMAIENSAGEALAKTIELNKMTIKSLTCEQILGMFENEVH